MQTNNKLREALVGLIDGICFHCDLSEVCKGVPCEKMQKAKAALAEPVRNCEVGTVEEQARRFDDYCHKQGNSCSVGRSKGACPMFKGYKVDCAIVWSQSLYEKGGADEQK